MSLVVVEGVSGVSGVGNAVLLTTRMIAAVIVADALADVAAAALEPGARPKAT